MKSCQMHGTVTKSLHRIYAHYWALDHGTGKSDVFSLSLFLSGSAIYSLNVQRSQGLIWCRVFLIELKAAKWWDQRQDDKQSRYTQVSFREVFGASADMQGKESRNPSAKARRWPRHYAQEKNKPVPTLTTLRQIMQNWTQCHQCICSTASRIGILPWKPLKAVDFPICSWRLHYVMKGRGFHFKLHIVLNIRMCMHPQTSGIIFVQNGSGIGLVLGSIVLVAYFVPCLEHHVTYFFRFFRFLGVKLGCAFLIRQSTLTLNSSSDKSKNLFPQLAPMV